MARPRSHKRAPMRIDEAELAAFRAGMRRRYSDEEILAELRAAAERAVTQGAVLALALGRLPKMADWAEARRSDPALLSEWQVYRLLDVPRGAWTAFQYLVRGRLLEDGAEVRPDGTLGGAD